MGTCPRFDTIAQYSNRGFLAGESTALVLVPHSLGPPLSHLCGLSRPDRRCGWSSPTRGESFSVLPTVQGHALEAAELLQSLHRHCCRGFLTPDKVCAHVSSVCPVPGILSPTPCGCPDLTPLSQTTLWLCKNLHKCVLVP